MNSAQLLPALRDLYSRLPKMYFREPWEPRHALFLLGYADDPADGAEIASSVEVARSGSPQSGAA